ncbi:formyltransferase family protein [Vibrio methylphosphonaticus]|uniref:formyltransferase family protein n=1 Tax=Vibrio methylphosphonaticus TaxID=2946866 RepID=UPI00202A31F9|nr:formyltransferase family protein [Vibrio methylphosphonaticus]MCL9775473.1 hypothetical protein [Vibrio methylphosphonaticus]
MRIIIITQDDPFYLSTNINYLLNELGKEHQVVGCVVSSVSPFGKKESLTQKALKTLRIFGVEFFIRYALRYIISKVNPSNNIRSVLSKHNVPEIVLNGSINSQESLNKLRDNRPDLLISIAGNEIFKIPLINLAPKGCLNLHTALLPKYRGLMPSFWVLKNQEEYSGVSVFFVDEGIDSGPILVQKKFSLKGLSQEKLIRYSKKLGMDAIVEAVDKISADSLDTIPNSDFEQSYYGFPTSKDVEEFRRVGGRFY